MILNMIMIIFLFYFQTTELHIDSDNTSSQVIEETEDDDNNDVVGNFETIADGSDDEYVPAGEASPSGLSTSTARRRKFQSKIDKNETGLAVDEDSKKNSVQCPICDKSFKSKYYLKVHNRYPVVL